MMDTTKLGEIFLDDNYSLEKLLNVTRQHGLSLGELRQLLTEYQQDLTKNSLELFNNNYDRFYKLSYIISCLQEPLQHLAEPIANFKDRVAQVCQNNDDYLQQINQKLSSLEETSKNKLYSKRLIELIRRRDRIEEQVNSIDWSVRALDSTKQTARQQQLSRREEDTEFQTKCDHLERVNVELYHLMNEVQAVRPTNDELISIKKSLEFSLNERLQQYDKWFEGAFLEAVELQDMTIIRLVVSTYQQTDSLDKIDTVWQKQIVRPYLNLTVTDSQLTSQITQTYNLILEFLTRNLKVIECDFIARSFWDEVVAALDKLDRLYSLDNLDTFKFHYEETRKFLNHQDQYVSEQHQMTASLVQNNKDKILNKFNLKGYFNHRLTQIASSVESSLTSSPLSEISHQQPSTTLDPVLSGYKIKICMHIYALVLKCWSPELYIDFLELNFVQLACRILNRFAAWLGKLRLSDFRITGPSSLDRQTNFLAKQDAIMRLLLSDCDQLAQQIRQYFKIDSPADTDEKPLLTRRELISESLKALSVGLSNVQSLQRLIER